MPGNGAIEDARIAAELKIMRVVREAARYVDRTRARDREATVAQFLMLSEAVDELADAAAEFNRLECAAAARGPV